MSQVGFGGCWRKSQPVRAQCEGVEGPSNPTRLGFCGVWRAPIPWELFPHTDTVSALGVKLQIPVLSPLRLDPDPINPPGKMDLGALLLSQLPWGRQGLAVGWIQLQLSSVPPGPCWNRPRTDGCSRTPTRKQQNPVPIPQPRANPQTSCRRWVSLSPSSALPHPRSSVLELCVLVLSLLWMTWGWCHARAAPKGTGLGAARDHSRISVTKAGMELPPSSLSWGRTSPAGL